MLKHCYNIRLCSKIKFDDKPVVVQFQWEILDGETMSERQKMKSSSFTNSSRGIIFTTSVTKENYNGINPVSMRFQWMILAQKYTLSE